MERQIELIAGIGSAALGLTAVVMEAQALSSPVTNPQLTYILASPSSLGLWSSVDTAQHALLPLALVFLALAFGAYLHVVHQQTAGFALVVSMSAVILAVTGLAVFLSPYAAVLFVQAPLVVGTALAAVAASVCALSLEASPAFLASLIHPRSRPVEARRHRST
jgi:hypothetical protein